MDLRDAHTLLEYHYWARDRLLDALDRLSPDHFTRDMGSSFSSVRDTAVHIYASELVWYGRWQGLPSSPVDPAVFADVASLRRAWTALEQRMRTFVDGLTAPDLVRTIDYKTMAGVAARSTLAQMLPHVVNHASYHRGQVTTMMRQLGAAPPKSMDLITFHRENSVQRVE